MPRQPTPHDQSGNPTRTKLNPHQDTTGEAGSPAHAARRTNPTTIAQPPATEPSCRGWHHTGDGFAPESRRAGKPSWRKCVEHRNPRRTDRAPKPRRTEPSPGGTRSGISQRRPPADLQAPADRNKERGAADKAQGPRPKARGTRRRVDGANSANGASKTKESETQRGRHKKPRRHSELRGNHRQGGAMKTSRCSRRYRGKAQSSARKRRAARCDENQGVQCGRTSGA
ncbi:hypothetical protein H4W33_005158 [Kibdelosporangium phytohabitans]|nr:hypothetical protein [Kibdelosporangium phytohabitans]